MRLTKREGGRRVTPSFSEVAEGSKSGWQERASGPAETTNELDPLKGLTRLPTLVEVIRKGGRELLGLKSLI